MNMSDDEQKLIDEAERYVKEHKHELIERFADPKIYIPDEHPVSLFMAGSPGAGKTELSKRLIKRFIEYIPIRIDADDIRGMFPNYTGVNSHIFQQACSKGVNLLFDYALEKNINAIIDGTFAYGLAMKNIDRSLKHGRRVTITYLFQDPVRAWDFTKRREETEGRRVPKEVFINAFIRAREHVVEAKTIFSSDVELDVVVKDFTQNTERVFPNIQKLDECLPKVYTVDELERLL